MKIGLIGGKGFLGSTFYRCLSTTSHDFDLIQRENYNDFIGNKYDILINANGNSKKYLAINEPKRDFLESVSSIQKSLIDFDYLTYVLCSSVDVYDNFIDVNKNHEDVEIIPEQISKYGLHKYLGEMLVKNYSNKWLIFRLGGLIGDGLKKNPIFDLINNIPLRVSIDSSYQYINTDFVAKATFKILNEGIRNQIFNLCGTGLVCLNDVNYKLNRDIIYNSENVPLETYEINNNKISKYIKIPTSNKAVDDYLKIIK